MKAQTRLGFHVTSEKTKIKIKNFKFLNIYLLACLQVGRPLCFENKTLFFSQCVTSALFLGNMLRAPKYRFAFYFRVLSNQYVERSAYADIFKFNRENERFERGKLNSRVGLFESRLTLTQD